MAKQTAQEVYEKISKLKKGIKKRKDELKLHYQDVPEYNEIEKEMKILRERRKKIVNEVNADHPDLVNQINDMRIDLENEKQVMNDIILVHVTKGETIELKDEHQQLVLPIFSFTLKKE